MPNKRKSKAFPTAEVVGGIIFVSLFISLILLAVFYDSSIEFTSSFFEDVSEAIQWK